MQLLSLADAQHLPPAAWLRCAQAGLILRHHLAHHANPHLHREDRRRHRQHSSRIPRRGREIKYHRRHLLPHLQAALYALSLIHI